MKLLSRMGSSVCRRTIVLAPASASTDMFSGTVVDPGLHSALLAQVQRLRGRAYMADGAIESWQVSSDGRHIQSLDYDSWHLLTLDERGRAMSCMRYLCHRPNIEFRKLTAAHSALAQSEKWGAAFRDAVETELAAAREQDLWYGEPGGLAVSEEMRCTTEAVRIVLSVYGLAQLLGGALCISTATTRHGSASILRRIGGRSLVSRGAQIPPYYDPQYKCEMEILRFDSARPSSRYLTMVDESRYHLSTLPVVCASHRKPSAVQFAVLGAANRDMSEFSAIGVD
jgi:hypothetical protein